MGVRSSDWTPISFHVQGEGKSILGSNLANIYGQENASTLPGLSSLLSWSAPEKVVHLLS